MAGNGCRKKGETLRRRSSKINPRDIGLDNEFELLIRLAGKYRRRMNTDEKDKVVVAV